MKLETLASFRQNIGKEHIIFFLMHFACIKAPFELEKKLLLIYMYR